VGRGKGKLGKKNGVGDRLCLALIKTKDRGSVPEKGVGTPTVEKDRDSVENVYSGLTGGGPRQNLSNTGGDF